MSPLVVRLLLLTLYVVVLGAAAVLPSRVVQVPAGRLLRSRT